MVLKEKLSGLSDMKVITGIIGGHTGAECIPSDHGFTITYNKGRGCDCALVREGYITSAVLCNCTKGFHETVWSEVFDCPVEVELIETFLRGGDCCSQKITLDKEER